MDLALAVIQELNSVCPVCLSHTDVMDQTGMGVGNSTDLLCMLPLLLVQPLFTPIQFPSHLNPHSLSLNLLLLYTFQGSLDLPKPGLSQGLSSLLFFMILVIMLS